MQLTNPIFQPTTRMMSLETNLSDLVNLTPPQMKTKYIHEQSNGVLQQELSVTGFLLLDTNQFISLRPWS